MIMHQRGEWDYSSLWNFISGVETRGGFAQSREYSDDLPHHHGLNSGGGSAIVPSSFSLSLFLSLLASSF